MSRRLLPDPAHPGERIKLKNVVLAKVFALRIGIDCACSEAAVNRFMKMLEVTPGCIDGIEQLT